MQMANNNPMMNNPMMNDPIMNNPMMNSPMMNNPMMNNPMMNNALMNNPMMNNPMMNNPMMNNPMMNPMMMNPMMMNMAAAAMVPNMYAMGSTPPGTFNQQMGAFPMQLQNTKVPQTMAGGPNPWMQTQAGFMPGGGTSAPSSPAPAPPTPSSRPDPHSPDASKKSMAPNMRTLQQSMPQQQMMMPFMPPQGLPGPFGLLPANSTSASFMASPPPALTGRKPICLYMPEDEKNISSYQCLARKQLELFEAQKNDIEAGAQGRNKPIALGQVGVRCIHCASLPNRQKARASAYYPSKLNNLYQTSQNIANTHLIKDCPAVPKEVRKELAILQARKSSSGGGKKYWAEMVQKLGVYDAGDGLRFLPSTGESREEGAGPPTI
jgi:hypothetical protein